MKFTPKRGLFHLIIAVVVILVSLRLVKSFPVLVVYAPFAIAWLLYWLIGGFFDMD